MVCVAPEIAKGAADYTRFVRKHRHYYAPTLQGEIESGVSHVHPALSPFGPPDAAAIPEINRAQIQRPHERTATYDRWQVGQPYANRETPTIRIRPARALGLPNPQLLARRSVGGAPRWRGSAFPLFAVFAVAVAALAAGRRAVPLDGSAAVVVAVAASLVLLAALLGVVALARSIRAAARYGAAAALEDFGAAVADALAAVGALPGYRGPAAVRLVVQPDGYYRCFLDGAPAEAGQLFVDALDELLAPLGSPRYIVPRYVDDPPRTALDTLRLGIRQAVFRRPGARAVYHAVPAYLAANRERVDAFMRARRRHVSPGDALYYQEPRAQAILEVQRGADPFQITTQMRTLWR